MATKKEQLLSIRLPSRDLDFIDRAARIRGSSRTEFVREAAVSAAAEVLVGRLAKAIAGKGKPVRALVKAFSRKAPWE